MNHKKRKNLRFLRLVPGLTYLVITTCIACRNEGSSSTGQDADRHTNTAQAASCQDAQGNVYPTVIIGTQTWMAENLKNTLVDCPDSLRMQFTNGIELGPGVRFYDGKPRFAYYNNQPEAGLGVIYNYAAIMHCALCPSGFGLPTKADWEQLVDQLGGASAAGPKLLAGGSSGFNATLGGRIDSYGSVLKDAIGFWWSMELEPNQNELEAYVLEIGANGYVKIVGQDIRAGNYVRCVKE